MEREADFTIEALETSVEQGLQEEGVARLPHEEGALVGCCCCCCAAAAERESGSGRIV